MLTAKAGMSKPSYAAGGLRKCAVPGAVPVQFLAVVDSVAPASLPLWRSPSDWLPLPSAQAAKTRRWR